MQTKDMLLKVIKDYGGEPDSLWQAILDVAYSEWFSSPEIQTYEQMLEWVDGVYGSEARLMIQLGKFNQQVTNGGHYQYFDNCYAGKGGGDIENHATLARLFFNHPLAKTELGQNLLSILQEFEITFEIDDEMYVYSYEDEDEVYNENYGYPTEYVRGVWERLDNTYYAFYESWEDAVEAYLKNSVEMVGV